MATSCRKGLDQDPSITVSFKRPPMGVQDHSMDRNIKLHASCIIVALSRATKTLPWVFKTLYSYQLHHSGMQWHGGPSFSCMQVASKLPHAGSPRPFIQLHWAETSSCMGVALVRNFHQIFSSKIFPAKVFWQEKVFDFPF